MSNDEECKTCGRPAAGHWLGCAEAETWKTVERDNVTVSTNADVCGYADCMDPRRSADKRVKFCETHSDPKNRK